MSNFESYTYNDAQEDPLEIQNNYHIPMAIIHNNISIEIELGKPLT